MRTKPWAASTKEEVAMIDATGDGQADSDLELEGLGISIAERSWLAEHYSETTTLWHVELNHFSFYDLNFLTSCPSSSCVPPPALLPPNDDDGSCTQVGSTIECTNQIFGEDVAIAGTPYRLHYRSDRVPGRLDNRSVSINATAGTVPPQLLSIDAELEVAGKVISRRLTCPCLPNRKITLEWDGRDTFGRELQGPQKAKLSLFYNYPSAVRAPCAFSKGCWVHGDRPAPWACGQAQGAGHG